MGSMYLPDCFVGRRNRFYSIGVICSVCLFGVVVGWSELLLLCSGQFGLVCLVGVPLKGGGYLWD